MEFAVDQFHFEIYQRITGNCAAGRSVFDPLFNRRSPVLRDRSAKYLVDKLKATATRQPFENASRFGELAAAAGLLLMASDDFSTTFESFEIGHLRLVQFNLYAIASLQLVDCYLNVGLTRTRQQKLFCLRLALKPQRRVLFQHLV